MRVGRGGTGNARGPLTKVTRQDRFRIAPGANFPAPFASAEGHAFLAASLFGGAHCPLHRTHANTVLAGVSSMGSSSPRMGRPRIRGWPASLRWGAAPLARDAREYGVGRRFFDGEQL